MRNYSRAIKRPFVSEHFWKLILRSLIPIYNIAVYGYIYECATNVMRGQYELPDWKTKGWFGYIANMLKIFVFVILGPLLFYIWIPLLIFLIVSYIFPENPYLNPLNLAVLGIIGLIFIYYIYILPGILIEYTRNWDDSNVNYGDVRKKAFTWNYFKTYFVMSVYVGFVSALFGLLMFIPFTSFLFQGPLIIITNIPFLTAFAETLYPAKIKSPS